MKTKFLTIEVEGIITIPQHPTAETYPSVEEIHTHEEIVMEAIQTAISSKGYLFMGELKIIANGRLEISIFAKTEDGEKVSTDDITPKESPVVTDSLKVKRKYKKSGKYAKKKK